MTPARMRTLLVVLVVLAALVVTVVVLRGRSDAAGPAAAPTATPSPAPEATPETPTDTATPAPTESPTESPTEGPGPGPTGSPDDVVLGLGGTFGGDELWLPEERVLTDLTASLGPPDTTQESAACPDGATRRVHRWDDLAVWVSLEPLDPGASVPGLEPVEPPFVEGWSLTGPSPALRTQEGLGFGSTVEELLALYPDAAPAAEGDAWEVFRGDFSNLAVEATSSAGDGTVTALVSGSVCAPR